MDESTQPTARPGGATLTMSQIQERLLSTSELLNKAIGCLALLAKAAASGSDNARAEVDLQRALWKDQGDLNDRVVLTLQALHQKATDGTPR